MSDPTLLEILSLGSDPPSVVPHFQSGLFDSLTSVTFDKGDKSRMTEMFSQQGEKVEFERPVEAKGNIETWLQRLVDGMQDTVKQGIKRAVKNVYVSGAGGWGGAQGLRCRWPGMHAGAGRELYAPVAGWRQALRQHGSSLVA